MIILPVDETITELIKELTDLWKDNYVAFESGPRQMGRCRAITLALANVEDMAQGWLAQPHPSFISCCKKH